MRCPLLRLIEVDTPELRYFPGGHVMTGTTPFAVSVDSFVGVCQLVYDENARPYVPASRRRAPSAAAASSRVALRGRVRARRRPRGVQRRRARATPLATARRRTAPSRSRARRTVVVRAAPSAARKAKACRACEQALRRYEEQFGHAASSPEPLGP